jgi:putative oxidoreductase
VTSINEGTACAAQAIGTFVGRALMSGLFIWSGYSKLTAAAATKAMFAKMGLPLPDVLWLVTVIIELGGGLALLVGFQARLTALVLCLWCIATALVAHTNFADLNMEIQFMKNVAMAGGFIFIALYGAGELSLDGALARFRQRGGSGR